MDELAPENSQTSDYISEHSEKKRKCDFYGPIYASKTAIY